MASAAKGEIVDSTFTKIYRILCDFHLFVQYFRINTNSFSFVILYILSCFKVSFFSTIITLILTILPFSSFGNLQIEPQLEEIRHGLRPAAKIPALARAEYNVYKRAVVAQRPMDKAIMAALSILVVSNHVPEDWQIEVIREGR